MESSMRKYAIIAAAASLLLLTACSDEDMPSVDAADDLSGDVADVDGSGEVDGDTIDPKIVTVNSQFARPSDFVTTCPEEDYSTEPPSDAGTANHPTEGSYGTLSEYNFFWGDMRDLQPVNGVFPYTSNSFLWADGTGKARFIALPAGEKAVFTDGELWEFPEGTIIVKNFMMPDDEREPNCGYVPLETRLLFRRGDTWVSETYVWNDERTEADRIRGGENLFVPVTNVRGQVESRLYGVPTRTQCSSCHGRSDGVDGATRDHLLGVGTPQMNGLVMRDGEAVNQLTWLAEQGVFSNEVPDPATLDSFANPMDLEVDTEDRARAYLHANCAHCHRTDGLAERSQLYLHYEETESNRLGVCKSPLATGPGAGGRAYDVVPGAPEESIMVYRMNSVEPQARMPELATKKVDNFGVDLVSDWIIGLDGSCSTDSE